MGSFSFCFWRLEFREESFIKDVVGDWFSQGKFRAAWGEIGNQNISSGAYLTRYGNSTYYLLGEFYDSVVEWWTYECRKS